MREVSVEETEFLLVVVAVLLLDFDFRFRLLLEKALLEENEEFLVLKMVLVVVADFLPLHFLLFEFFHIHPRLNQTTILN